MSDESDTPGSNLDGMKKYEQRLRDLEIIAEKQAHILGLLTGHIASSMLVNRAIVCALWDQLPVEEMRASIVKILAAGGDANGEAIASVEAIFGPPAPFEELVSPEAGSTPAALRAVFRVIEGGAGRLAD